MIGDIRGGESMDITYFNEFLVLANKKKYSLAAEELALSQSALSKHIQTMERELGVQLLDRTTRSVTLSQDGEALLPELTAISEQYAQLLDEAEKRQRRRRKTLRIGVMPAMGEYGIGRLLYEFKGTAEVSVSAREVQIDLLPGLLLNKDLDSIILPKRPDLSDSEFCTLPILEDQIMAVFRADSPLFQQDSISLHDLKDIPLLTLDREAQIASFEDSLCAAMDFAPHVAAHCQRAVNLLELAELGVGIGILPSRRADLDHHPALKGVPIRDLPALRIVAVCLQKFRKTAPVRAWMDYVEKVAKC